jgi:hypothetical protein
VRQKREGGESTPPELGVGRVGFAVMFDVGLGGFGSVMSCVLVMTISQVRVMCCGLMLAGFVVAGGFPVVMGRVLVMLCCLVMMLYRVL